MLASPPRSLSFDQFTLDTVRCVLLRGRRELPLRRQSFEVLRYLAEHAGKVVSSDELIEALWSSKPADQNASVGQCIMEIRRAIGDDARWIIKTVSGRGYEFMAEVRSDLASSAPVTPVADAGKTPNATAQVVAGGGNPLAALASERPFWRSKRLLAVALSPVLVGAAWMLWPWRDQALPHGVLTMMAAPSITVLPFKSVGQEPDKGDISSTLTEDVTTELARVPLTYSLRIRSAPGYNVPAQHPSHVGRELGVRYLLLGSVRGDGDVRHVNVQIIEAEGNRPVWAEPFSYAAGDPEEHNRMAARIARTVHAQVRNVESRLPLPAQPEAGHFVILGRATLLGSMEARQKAKAFFDKARELDPDSVPALLGYGRARVNEVLNRWAPKGQWGALLDAAEVAIKHAEGIDSRNAALHVLRGAWLRARERHEDAMAAFQRAVDLHPYYPIAHAELGRAKIEVGQAAQTVQHIQEAIRLSPNDTNVASWYYWAGMAEAHVGRYESAVDWLLKARNEKRAYPNTAVWLAVAYGGLGHRDDEARDYLQEHRRNWPMWTISTWHDALPTSHPTVKEQRALTAAILCRLGAPGCEAATGSTR